MFTLCLNYFRINSCYASLGSNPVRYAARLSGLCGTCFIFTFSRVFLNIIIWRFPLRLVISVIEAGVETGLIPLLAMFTHNSVN